MTELSERIERSKDEFNSMDAACGDGDFGTTMASAFGDAKKAIEKASGNDVGSLLMSMGNSILSSAGGASGPTIATFFMEAGKFAKGKSELGLRDLASMLDKSLQKIQLLGGAKVGDKTLVDALEPAVRELKASVEADVPLRDALTGAVEAAMIGCESTKGLVAKHGRAKYLGEQTLGCVDPGAHLISLTFVTLVAATSH